MSPPTPCGRCVLVNRMGEPLVYMSGEMFEHSRPDMAKEPINLDSLCEEEWLPQGALSEHLEHIRNAVESWGGRPTFVSATKWDKDCREARRYFLRLKNKQTTATVEAKRWIVMRYRACLSFESLRRQTRQLPLVWEPPQVLLGIYKLWVFEFMDRRILPNSMLHFHEGNHVHPPWAALARWKGF